MFGATAPGTSSGLFGSSSSASSSSLFGGGGSSLFGGGASSSTSLFGAASAGKPSASGGLFGSTSLGSSSGSSALFGGAGSAAMPQPASSGGLFGSSTTHASASSSLVPGGSAAASANAVTGLFGAGSSTLSPFGSGAATDKPAGSGGLFGTSADSSSQEASSKNIFGTGAPFSSPFGGASGSSAPAGSRGLFGTAATSSSSSSSSASLCGGSGSVAAEKPASGGLYGSSDAPFNLFSGGNTASSATSGTGLFGAAASAPAASSSSSSSLFGAGAHADKSAAPGGLFGNSASSSSSSSGGGLFGAAASAPAASSSSSSSLFGAGAPADKSAAPGGLFGNSASSSSSSSGGGLFGAAASAPAASSSSSSSLFGAGAPADKSAAPGGLFGNSASSSSSSSGVGLFGAAASAPAASSSSSSSLFGAGAPADKSAAPGGLFGNSASCSSSSSGGGLFGAAASAPAASSSSSSSLFGAGAPADKSAAPGGLFGNSASSSSSSSGGGLFGAAASAPAASSSSSSSLFGAGAPADKSAAPGGLFGNSASSSSSSSGGGLFGAASSSVLFCGSNEKTTSPPGSASPAAAFPSSTNTPPPTGKESGATAAPIFSGSAAEAKATEPVACSSALCASSSLFGATGAPVAPQPAAAASASLAGSSPEIRKCLVSYIHLKSVLLSLSLSDSPAHVRELFSSPQLLQRFASLLSPFDPSIDRALPQNISPDLQAAITAVRTQLARKASQQPRAASATAAPDERDWGVAVPSEAMIYEALSVYLLRKFNKQQQLLSPRLSAPFLQEAIDPEDPVTLREIEDILVGEQVDFFWCLAFIFRTASSSAPAQEAGGKAPDRSGAAESASKKKVDDSGTEPDEPAAAASRAPSSLQKACFRFACRLVSEKNIEEGLYRAYEELSRRVDARKGASQCGAGAPEGGGVKREASGRGASAADAAASQCLADDPGRVKALAATLRIQKSLLLCFVAFYRARSVLEACRTGGKAPSEKGAQSFSAATLHRLASMVSDDAFVGALAAGSSEDRRLLQSARLLLAGQEVADASAVLLVSVYPFALFCGGSAPAGRREESQTPGEETLAQLGSADRFAALHRGVMTPLLNAFESQVGRETRGTSVQVLALASSVALAGDPRSAGDSLADSLAADGAEERSSEGTAAYPDALYEQFIAHPSVTPIVLFAHAAALAMLRERRKKTSAATAERAAKPHTGCRETQAPFVLSDAEVDAFLNPLLLCGGPSFAAALEALVVVRDGLRQAGSAAAAADPLLSMQREVLLEFLHVFLLYLPLHHFQGFEPFIHALAGLVDSPGVADDLWLLSSPRQRSLLFSPSPSNSVVSAGFASQSDARALASREGDFGVGGESLASRVAAPACATCGVWGDFVAGLQRNTQMSQEALHARLAQQPRYGGLYVVIELFRSVTFPFGLHLLLQLVAALVPRASASRVVERNPQADEEEEEAEEEEPVIDATSLAAFLLFLTEPLSSMLLPPLPEFFLPALAPPAAAVEAPARQETHSQGEGGLGASLSRSLSCNSPSPLRCTYTSVGPVPLELCLGTMLGFQEPVEAGRGEGEDGDDARAGFFDASSVSGGAAFWSLLPPGVAAQPQGLPVWRLMNAAAFACASTAAAARESAAQEQEARSARAKASVAGAPCLPRYEGEGWWAQYADGTSAVPALRRVGAKLEEEQLSRFGSAASCASAYSCGTASSSSSFVVEEEADDPDAAMLLYALRVPLSARGRGGAAAQSEEAEAGMRGGGAHLRGLADDALKAATPSLSLLRVAWFVWDAGLQFLAQTGRPLPDAALSAFVSATALFSRLAAWPPAMRLVAELTVAEQVYGLSGPAAALAVNAATLAASASVREVLSLFRGAGVAGAGDAHELDAFLDRSRHSAAVAPFALLPRLFALACLAGQQPQLRCILPELLTGLRLLWPMDAEDGGVSPSSSAPRVCRSLFSRLGAEDCEEPLVCRLPPLLLQPQTSDVLSGDLASAPESVHTYWQLLMLFSVFLSSRAAGDGRELLEPDAQRMQRSALFTQIFSAYFSASSSSLLSLSLPATAVPAASLAAPQFFSPAFLRASTRAAGTREAREACGELQQAQPLPFSLRSFLQTLTEVTEEERDAGTYPVLRSTLLLLLHLLQLCPPSALALSWQQHAAFSAATVAESARELLERERARSDSVAAAEEAVEREGCDAALEAKRGEHPMFLAFLAPFRELARMQFGGAHETEAQTEADLSTGADGVKRGRDGADSLEDSYWVLLPTHSTPLGSQKGGGAGDLQSALREGADSSAAHTPSREARDALARLADCSLSQGVATFLERRQLAQLEEQRDTFGALCEFLFSSVWSRIEGCSFLHFAERAELVEILLAATTETLSLLQGANRLPSSEDADPDREGEAPTRDRALPGGLGAGERAVKKRRGDENDEVARAWTAALEREGLNLDSLKERLQSSEQDAAGSVQATLTADSGFWSLREADSMENEAVESRGRRTRLQVLFWDNRGGVFARRAATLAVYGHVELTNRLLEQLSASNFLSSLAALLRCDSLLELCPPYARAQPLPASSAPFLFAFVNSVLLSLASLDFHSLASTSWITPLAARMLGAPPLHPPERRLLRTSRLSPCSGPSAPLLLLLPASCRAPGTAGGGEPVEGQSTSREVRPEGLRQGGRFEAEPQPHACAICGSLSSLFAFSPPSFASGSVGPLSPAVSPWTSSAASTRLSRVSSLPMVFVLASPGVSSLAAPGERYSPAWSPGRWSTHWVGAALRESVPFCLSASGAASLLTFFSFQAALPGSSSSLSLSTSPAVLPPEAALCASAVTSPNTDRSQNIVCLVVQAFLHLFLATCVSPTGSALGRGGGEGEGAGAVCSPLATLVSAAARRAGAVEPPDGGRKRKMAGAPLAPVSVAEPLLSRLQRQLSRLAFSASSALPEDVGVSASPLSPSVPDLLPSYAGDALAAAQDYDAFLVAGVRAGASLLTAPGGHAALFCQSRSRQQTKVLAPANFVQSVFALLEGSSRIKVVAASLLNILTVASLELQRSQGQEGETSAGTSGEFEGAGAGLKGLRRADVHRGPETRPALPASSRFCSASPFSVCLAYAPPELQSLLERWRDLVRAKAGDKEGATAAEGQTKASAAERLSRRRQIRFIDLLVPSGVLSKGLRELYVKEPMKEYRLLLLQLLLLLLAGASERDKDSSSRFCAQQEDLIFIGGGGGSLQDECEGSDGEAEPLLWTTVNFSQQILLDVLAASSPADKSSASGRGAIGPKSGKEGAASGRLVESLGDLKLLRLALLLLEQLCFSSGAQAVHLQLLQQTVCGVRRMSSLRRDRREANADAAGGEDSFAGASAFASAAKGGSPAKGEDDATSAGGWKLLLSVACTLLSTWQKLDWARARLWLATASGAAERKALARPATQHATLSSQASLGDLPPLEAGGPPLCSRLITSAGFDLPLYAPLDAALSPLPQAFAAATGRAASGDSADGPRGAFSRRPSGSLRLSGGVSVAGSGGAGLKAKCAGLGPSAQGGERGEEDEAGASSAVSAPFSGSVASFFSRGGAGEPGGSGCAAAGACAPSPAGWGGEEEEEELGFLASLAAIELCGAFQALFRILVSQLHALPLSIPVEAKQTSSGAHAPGDKKTRSIAHLFVDRPPTLADYRDFFNLFYFLSSEPSVLAAFFPAKAQGAAGDSDPRASQAASSSLGLAPLPETQRSLLRLLLWLRSRSISPAYLQQAQPRSPACSVSFVPAPGAGSGTGCSSPLSPSAQATAALPVPPPTGRRARGLLRAPGERRNNLENFADFWMRKRLLRPALEEGVGGEGCALLQALSSPLLSDDPAQGEEARSCADGGSPVLPVSLVRACGVLSSPEQFGAGFIFDRRTLVLLATHVALQTLPLAHFSSSSASCGEESRRACRAEPLLGAACDAGWKSSGRRKRKEGGSSLAAYFPSSLASQAWTAGVFASRVGVGEALADAQLALLSAFFQLLCASREKAIFPLYFMPRKKTPAGVTNMLEPGEAAQGGEPERVGKNVLSPLGDAEPPFQAAIFPVLSTLVDVCEQEKGLAAGTPFGVYLFRSAFFRLLLALSLQLVTCNWTTDLRASSAAPKLLLARGSPLASALAPAPPADKAADKSPALSPRSGSLFGASCPAAPLSPVRHPEDHEDSSSPSEPAARRSVGEVLISLTPSQEGTHASFGSGAAEGGGASSGFSCRASGARGGGAWSRSPSFSAQPVVGRADRDYFFQRFCVKVDALCSAPGRAGDGGRTAILAPMWQNEALKDVSREILHPPLASLSTPLFCSGTRRACFPSAEILRNVLRAAEAFEGEQGDCAGGAGKTRREEGAAPGVTRRQRAAELLYKVQKCLLAVLREKVAQESERGWGASGKRLPALHDGFAEYAYEGRLAARGGSGETKGVTQFHLPAFSSLLSFFPRSAASRDRGAAVGAALTGPGTSRRRGLFSSFYPAVEAAHRSALLFSAPIASSAPEPHEACEQGRSTPSASSPSAAVFPPTRQAPGADAGGGPRAPGQAPERGEAAREPLPFLVAETRLREESRAWTDAFGLARTPPEEADFLDMLAALDGVKVFAALWSFLCVCGGETEQELAGGASAPSSRRQKGTEGEADGAPSLARASQRAEHESEEKAASSSLAAFWAEALETQLAGLLSQAHSVWGLFTPAASRAAAGALTGGAALQRDESFADLSPALLSSPLAGGVVSASGATAATRIAYLLATAPRTPALLRISSLLYLSLPRLFLNACVSLLDSSAAAVYAARRQAARGAAAGAGDREGAPGSQLVSLSLSEIFRPQGETGSQRPSSLLGVGVVERRDRSLSSGETEDEERRLSRSEGQDTSASAAAMPLLLHPNLFTPRISEDSAYLGQGRSDVQLEGAAAGRACDDDRAATLAPFDPVVAHVLQKALERLPLSGEAGGRCESDEGAREEFGGVANGRRDLSCGGRDISSCFAAPLAAFLQLPLLAFLPPAVRSLSAQIQQQATLLNSRFPAVAPTTTRELWAAQQLLLLHQPLPRVLSFSASLLPGALGADACGARGAEAEAKKQEEALFSPKLSLLLQHPNFLVEEVASRTLSSFVAFFALLVQSGVAPRRAGGAAGLFSRTAALEAPLLDAGLGRCTLAGGDERRATAGLHFFSAEGDESAKAKSAFLSQAAPPASSLSPAPSQAPSNWQDARSLSLPEALLDADFFLSLVMLPSFQSYLQPVRKPAMPPLPPSHVARRSPEADLSGSAPWVPAYELLLLPAAANGQRGQEGDAAVLGGEARVANATDAASAALVQVRRAPSHLLFCRMLGLLALGLHQLPESSRARVSCAESRGGGGGGLRGRPTWAQAEPQAGRAKERVAALLRVLQLLERRMQFVLGPRGFVRASQLALLEEGTLYAQLLTLLPPWSAMDADQQQFVWRWFSLLRDFALSLCRGLLLSLVDGVPVLRPVSVLERLGAQPPLRASSAACGAASSADVSLSALVYSSLAAGVPGLRSAMRVRLGEAGYEAIARGAARAATGGQRQTLWESLWGGADEKEQGERAPVAVPSTFHQRGIFLMLEVCNSAVSAFSKFGFLLPLDHTFPPPASFFLPGCACCPPSPSSCDCSSGGRFGGADTSHWCRRVRAISPKRYRELITSLFSCAPAAPAGGESAREKSHGNRCARRRHGKKNERARSEGCASRSPSPVPSLAHEGNPRDRDAVRLASPLGEDTLKLSEDSERRPQRGAAFAAPADTDIPRAGGCEGGAGKNAAEVDAELTEGRGRGEAGRTRRSFLPPAQEIAQTLGVFVDIAKALTKILDELAREDRTLPLAILTTRDRRYLPLSLFLRCEGPYMNSLSSLASPRPSQRQASADQPSVLWASWARSPTPGSVSPSHSSVCGAGRAASVVSLTPTASGVGFESSTRDGEGARDASGRGCARGRDDASVLSFHRGTSADRQGGGALSAVSFAGRQRAEQRRSLHRRRRGSPTVTACRLARVADRGAVSGLFCRERGAPESSVSLLGIGEEDQELEVVCPELLQHEALWERLRDTVEKAMTAGTAIINAFVAQNILRHYADAAKQFLPLLIHLGAASSHQSSSSLTVSTSSLIPPGAAHLLRPSSAGDSRSEATVSRDDSGATSRDFYATLLQYLLKRYAVEERVFEASRGVCFPAVLDLHEDADVRRKEEGGATLR
ncbi:hypothetical protein BESB_074420 [Besnoitia besnoiti]|uniref:Nucleoporin FG repeat region protein n=1 Tax=Besnoitia besnoiti TaxID=94643 RepID=A0A2A9MFY5_BESBE|nr:uncharacterized protein BESB_074420 [Besnoitia besnoiti]PFH34290.1 hypothetical protein BESB_074420 [Besnoitia besnoiti]